MPPPPGQCWALVPPPPFLATPPPLGPRSIGNLRCRNISLGHTGTVAVLVLSFCGAIPPPLSGKLSCRCTPQRAQVSAGVGRPLHGPGVCIWMHWSTARATAPSPGRPTPGVVKQDKSSGGSVDTTKTRPDPQRVRMSSGERPIGAAKGKQSDTEAFCQPPPPPPEGGLSLRDPPPPREGKGHNTGGEGLQGGRKVPCCTTANLSQHASAQHNPAQPPPPPTIPHTAVHHSINCRRCRHVWWQSTLEGEGPAPPLSRAPSLWPSHCLSCHKCWPQWHL